MSEEDLELLITLDDPEGAPEEDIFIHPAENTLEYWIGQPTTTSASAKRPERSTKSKSEI